ncbi:MAG: pyridoxine 5'-phosphate synthase [Elusimicrobia bacterium]|nr:pyridoxine 5'-phosphate synthase [Elusimicrobiota bacterium]
MIKLGVNINHVATLRQARKGVDPDLVAAAKVCRSAGADLLVVHFQRDGTPIQEEDLFALRRQAKLPLHLEVAASPEMLKIALKVRPDSICLVPDSNSEWAPRKGLDFHKGSLGFLVRAIQTLRKNGIETGLLVNPDAGDVRKAKSLGADIMELCTVDYARAWGKHRQREELEKLELAGCLTGELGLKLYAGYGLDYHNAAPVSQIPGLECLNIGFSIVSRALFVGLRTAVKEMKQLIRQ